MAGCKTGSCQKCSVVRSGVGLVAVRSVVLCGRVCRTALAVEEVIRDCGAIPATVGVLKGRVCVGKSVCSVGKSVCMLVGVCMCW